MFPKFFGKNFFPLARPCVDVPQAVHSVKQKVLVIADDDKEDLLFENIKNMSPEDKLLVFVGRKILYVTRVYRIIVT